eukprot:g2991.t1
MSSYGSVPTFDAEDDATMKARNNPASEGALALVPQREYVDSADADAEGASDRKQLISGHGGASAGSWCASCRLKRMHLGVLGLLMELVCYADRTNISLAILPMQEALGWDDSVDGIVLASFFVGYATTQVLGGWAAARWGGKPVLCWAVGLWSVFTLLTPAAARVSLPVLYACRALMGVAEGVSLPCMHHLIAMWVPVHERSRFVTLCTSGQFAGTVAAMACSPMVARDWASIFYLWGAVGFAWVAAWLWLAASSPEQHRGIGADELAFIRRHAPRPGRTDVVPWAALFRSTPFRAVVCAHFAHNWGWYLLLSWLPKYLKELGVDTAQVGFYLIPCYTAPFVASNASGWTADRLAFVRGWRLGAVRKLMQALAFAGPMVCLAVLCVAAQPTPALAVVLASGALGFGACSHSGYWANIIDLSPRYAGVLIGISNTIATFAGVFCNLATGYILNATDKNYAAVFGVAIAVYAVGLVVYACFASGEPQDFGGESEDTPARGNKDNNGVHNKEEGAVAAGQV